MSVSGRTAPGGGAAPSTPRQPAAHFDALDAYRGIAALLIVVHHAYLLMRDDAGRHLYAGSLPHFLLANLDVGVTWFFTLSGFLLFLPFARAVVEGREPPSARAFLARRAWRILPLYFVVVLASWARYGDGSADSRTDLLKHLTFTHVFDPRYFYGMLDVAWSLGVEAMFYLVLAAVGPPLCRATLSLAAGRDRVAVLTGALAALALLSGGYKWWALHAPGATPGQPHVYLGPLAQFDVFALGMAVAVACAAARGQSVLGRRVQAALTAASGMLLSVALLLRHTGPIAWTYFGSLSGAAFALLLAATVLGAGGGPLRRVLGHPAFQGLGAISYSLYLWHRPLLNELSTTVLHSSARAFPAQLLAILAVALLAAAGSYWCIERPTLQWRRGQPQHPKAPVPTGGHAPGAHQNQPSP
jgi:peptidoglycan/LPS O-acetylase OafA/YrhL